MDQNSASGCKGVGGIGDEAAASCGSRPGSTWPITNELKKFLMRISGLLTAAKWAARSLRQWDVASKWTARDAARPTGQPHLSRRPKRLAGQNPATLRPDLGDGPPGARIPDDKCQF
jgi:hypothetical protein